MRIIAICLLVYKTSRFCLNKYEHQENTTPLSQSEQRKSLYAQISILADWLINSHIQALMD